MKTAVIFWSGTGNTEAMAAAVADGARGVGADVTLAACTEFDTATLDSFDSFAFGCAAMGAEELEETEFEPMFAEIEDRLSGKKVVLFGSYGWGDGEWLRSWEDRCRSKGITLAAESVMCCEMPDDDGLAQCRALGAALA